MIRLWLFWFGLFFGIPAMLVYLRIRHWWLDRRRAQGRRERR